MILFCSVGIVVVVVEKEMNVLEMKWNENFCLSFISVVLQNEISVKVISTPDNASSSFDYGLDMGTESQVENPLVDADSEDVHTAILRDHISVTMLKNKVTHRNVFNFSQYDEDIDVRPHQHYHRKIYPSRSYFFLLLLLLFLFLIHSFINHSSFIYVYVCVCVRELSVIFQFQPSAGDGTKAHYVMCLPCRNVFYSLWCFVLHIVRL